MMKNVKTFSALKATKDFNSEFFSSAQPILLSSRMPESSHKKLFLSFFPLSTKFKSNPVSFKNNPINSRPTTHLIKEIEPS